MNNMKRVPMTPEGYKALVQELKHHMEVLRPEVVKSIEEARAHGDISENSEFEAAKERQAMIEARIGELNQRIGMAEVIDVRQIPETGRVVFGATVRLLDLQTEEELVYRIVGSHEADIPKGAIPITAPIGRSLLGKEVGDEVHVRIPKGTREFEILEVQHI